MEAYPAEYTEHNLPLILLSGLGEQTNDKPLSSNSTQRESGTQIKASAPECSGERAQHLLQQFLQYDGSDRRWNPTSLPGPSGNLRYNMKTIGRTYTLPPRKAAPLPQPTSPEGFQSNYGRGSELHSSLSPLSPGSPIFPDGVFTPLWFAKHQQQVPALFIAFFHISASDQSGQSEQQLKSDINLIRSSINQSGFKTKFAVVLISDRSILQAPELEDRLSSIRRQTNLDSKTGLFFMPPMSSQSEIATFVQSVMTTLQPLCVDYYRDLTKHARRKKVRASSSSSPTISSPVAGALQSLSTSGWNARYEAKQGIFAEFRQEMDVAERHYSAAIDEMFNSEGLFETTPHWSPRWDEARLFCDALALRVIRCQLWTGMTTGAAQSWVNYKARMKDLIDRRGKGSQTYGWAAWEARWAEIMAELIRRADLQDLRAASKGASDESISELSQRPVYIMHEKTVPSTERVPPFQHLHHPGYWLRLALNGTRARRKRALEIPDEDRVPPDRSPASAVASRSKNYDCYLVPDPHEEYPLEEGGTTRDQVADIARMSEDAVAEFQARGQTRVIELMKLDLARDFADSERYDSAIGILVPLWVGTTWRGNDWQDLFAELLLLLRRCAEHSSDGAEVLVGTTYELMSVRSTLPDGLELDLLRCLDNVKVSLSVPIALTFTDQERQSPVAISFAFYAKESHVGEALECQVTISSRMNARAETLTLSSVALTFGSSKIVKIVHDGSAPNSDLVELGDTPQKANLTLEATPRRTFSFSLACRDAEILRLTQASLAVGTERFSIEHSFTDETTLRSDSIILRMEHEGLKSKYLTHEETNVINVLPKPPKVQLFVHGLKKQYYTDETVHLSVEVLNEETEAVDAKISVQASGEVENVVALRWMGQEEDGSSAVVTDGESQEQTAAKTIPRLEPTSRHKLGLLLKAPSEPHKTTIIIGANYTLASDDTAPLEKALSLELSFTVPFEAKFKFGPLLYPDPWPSYFDPTAGTTREHSGGIPQLWHLSSHLRSLATSNIVLHKADIVIDSVAGDSQAEAKNQDPEETCVFGSGQILEYSFELRTQKFSLDDRRQTAVESTLEVTWSRDRDSEPVKTHVRVPRLTLPASEPRVLCTIAKGSADDGDEILQYHIENPSTHFLTFALTMEASEEFAFSGPKYRALSVAPLSRHRVEYRLAVHDNSDDSETAEGRWIWPALQVIDSYYQKTLRVHPGGENVKVDEKGNIGVWIEAS